MTQAALIIGATQRKQIAELRVLAAANVQDPTQVINTARRDIKAYRDMMNALTVEIPLGYFVTYTHELQPHHGLCHHISISVDRPRKMPSVEAVEMLLEEFGMEPLKRSRGVWIEEVDPTTSAINILQTINP